MRHRLNRHTPLIFSVSAIGMLMLVSAGCQQTTGITPGSPLTSVSPLAPNGLSPIQPTSAVGPLGQSTRVPPPSTGSYSVPNNYMGGQVPLSQIPNQQGFHPNSGSPNAGSLGGWQNSNVAPVSGLAPVGSGVAQAGGTAGSTLGHGSAFPPSSFGGGPMVPSTNQRPQSGGMQVIDLTGAPPPPGYQSPSYYSVNPFQSPTNQPISPGGFQQPLVPYNPASGVIQSTPSMLPPLNQSTSPPPVALPDARLQAGAASDVDQQNLRAVTPPPTTDPVRTAERGSLPWRSPAPRF